VIKGSSGQRRKGRVCLCLNCGQTFLASRYDAKFHSVACRVAYHRAKNIEVHNTRTDDTRKNEQKSRLSQLIMKI
jgi:hypothetical protein